MAEWSIAAVLKTVEPQGSGGSNPSLSVLTSRFWRMGVLLRNIFDSHVHKYASTLKFSCACPCIKRSLKSVTKGRIILRTSNVGYDFY